MDTAMKFIMQGLVVVFMSKNKLAGLVAFAAKMQ